MYTVRTEHRVNTAAILNRVTCWTRPHIADQAIHQQFQKFKTELLLVAQEPPVKTITMSKDIPSNLKMDVELFLDLLVRHRERGNPVDKEYTKAIQFY